MKCQKKIEDALYPLGDISQNKDIFERSQFYSLSNGAHYRIG